MLGVSRQRVQQLVSRPDFPKPAAVLAMGKGWRTADGQAWARAHGRLSEG
jgi:prophage regulatory protein